LKGPPNPLRSEGDAFTFLVWCVGAIAIVVVIVLLVRAI
jgi:hypothetical protein